MADDFTGVIAVSGLSPSTDYRYQLRINGRVLPRGEGWEFRTFPAPDQAEGVRIAFGGWAKYFPEDERIWDTIRRRQPHALLLLGDNVYLTLPGSVGPLTNERGTEGSGQPIFQYLNGPAFGLLTVRGTGDGPSAKVEIVTLQGETVFQRDLSLAELRD